PRSTCRMSTLPLNTRRLSRCVPHSPNPWVRTPATMSSTRALRPMALRRFISSPLTFCEPVEHGIEMVRYDGLYNCQLGRADAFPTGSTQCGLPSDTKNQHLPQE